MTTGESVPQRGILSTRFEGCGILRLVLNNPAQRNALSEAMMSALSAALASAAQDPKVRVIVLASTGNVFCAGHDLKEMTAARQQSDGGRARFTDLLQKCSALMMAIVTNPKPVIAEVDGLATAAGCQLVASCDLAYATPDSGFCTPGVHIGLFCSTPMVALSRNLAGKHTMEMLLTGAVVSAARAAEMGLVNAVIDSADLNGHVAAVARQICAKSPATLAIGKGAFYKQREMRLEEAYDYAVGVMVDNMLHQDAKEGINAFIEKRDPQW